MLINISQTTNLFRPQTKWLLSSPPEGPKKFFAPFLQPFFL